LVVNAFKNDLKEENVRQAFLFQFAHKPLCGKIKSMKLPAFRRSRATWQAYLSNAYFSYFINTLGPLAPFLRDELGLTYTVASLHMSAYALGTVLTGLVLSRIIRRAGAYRVVWGGAVGMALGALLIIVGRHEAVTIAGAFLMGVLGVGIIAIFQGVLAEQHGEQRGVALIEFSVVGTVLAALAPLAVGIFARTPLTWRAAVALGPLFLAALWLAFRTDRVGPSAPAPSGKPAADGAATSPRVDASGRLPFIYWLYWAAGLLAVAIEFCYLLWGADYLEKVGGLARPDAALGMSLFMGFMLAGRIINSRLIWAVPARGLLAVSLGITALGYALFWLGPIALAGSPGLVALAGLALSGLGIAGLYPLLASLALGASPGRIVEASASFTLSAGIAILAMPLLLGRLADWIGIRDAYGLLALLLVLSGVLNAAAGRIQSRERVRQAL